MKKYLSMLLLLCLIPILATTCSNEGFSPPDSSSPETQDNAAAAEKIIDVDLTVLSSTMVYAEVNHMLINPDNYMGKTIKMSGPYYSSYYDETGLYYHYVIIQDAAACCQQGLEFIWNGEHSYPEDYPETQAKIEVTGVFGRYEELGQTYCYLAVDDISLIK